MSRAFSFGSTISILAAASVMAGCAAPQSRVATGFGGQANGEIGLATRAMAALNSNDVPAAIGFAERAVEKTPNDAGFRALLGNAYFAGGRFQSAEAAYRDSLTLYSNQPQVVLKLALVEIALGKSGEALSFLDAAKDVLDPADYGLAVALAGRPADAISVLETAARAPGADARVRQNLALAFALAGDWTNARTVAAQDVPGDQVDARIHQWMQLASPKKPSDQVAALVGVTPAAVDPGQPTQLALNKSDSRLAQAAPAPQPQFAEALPAPQPPVAEAAPPPPPPVAVASADPAPPMEQPVSIAAAPAAAREVSVANVAAPKAAAPAPKAVKVKSASAARKRPPIRQAAIRRGNSKAVVQLGSFSNPKSVLSAWNVAARRYSALRGYAPMSARFASARGTLFRLSVHGFASVNEASALCASLRRVGGACFVRNVAGDAPVQIAMR
ncbi:MAG: tetratricopeptide repeat protein [Sphingomicrobium sp.]